MTLPAHEPLVTLTRGDTDELVHFGSIAVVDRAGKLISGRGEPRSLQFTRSSLKPLQALPFVEDGGLGRFGFGSQELALMCASHSGEAMHVEVVRRILARIDAGVADLQCGSHDPMFYAATGQPAPRATWSALFHNCSGKHSGFLSYCRLHRHRLADYLDAEAPLQVRIRNTVQAYAGAAPIGAGTDGCGAPNFALPLASLAHAYARIASDDDPALGAIFYAMTRHPELASGTQRTDLALMSAGARTGSPDWVTKIGADGVQAIGVRSRGIGIAIRIADGNPRALHVATGEVLRQLGLIERDADDRLPVEFGRPPIRNHAGREVGRLEPVFSLAS